MKVDGKLTVNQLVEYLEKYRGVCKYTGEEYYVEAVVAQGLTSDIESIIYIHHGVVCLKPKVNIKDEE